MEAPRLQRFLVGSGRFILHFFVLQREGLGLDIDVIHFEVPLKQPPQLLFASRAPHAIAEQDFTRTAAGRYESLT